MSRLGCLIALTFVMTSCSSVPKSPPLNPQMEQIIFIPGYYGTRLEQKTEKGSKIIWINLTQAVSGSTPLALPGLGVPKTVELMPTELLDEVVLFPGLFSKNFYGDIFEDLVEAFEGKAQVHALTYDWRLNYYEAVKLLDAKINEFKEKGVKKISVVAHSMGGLIASYYLRYGGQAPEKAKDDWRGSKNIHKAVIGMAPYQGSMLMFCNMKHGDVFVLNDTLASNESLSSFNAAYVLLPRYNGTVLDEEFKPLKLNLTQVENWEKNGWGLFRNKEHPPEMNQKRKDHTLSAMKQANLMYEKLHAKKRSKTNLDTELFYFYGHGEFMINQVVHQKTDPGNYLCRQKEFEDKYPEKEFLMLLEDGDGSVTVKSAQIPNAYKSALKFTEESFTINHVEAMGDEQVITRIIEFLKSSPTPTE